MNNKNTQNNIFNNNNNISNNSGYNDNYNNNCITDRAINNKNILIPPNNKISYIYKKKI